ncbi:MAG: hypothetical protein JJU45_13060 [Acidimicrobiia bacterium]|nr:hypothetical protein [Acidimicrobiia bacterium]
MATNHLTIDCAECAYDGTPTCDDCMVTFLCSRREGEAVVIDLEEARAVRLIGESGLTPPLRHEVRRQDHG